MRRSTDRRAWLVGSGISLLAALGVAPAYGQHGGGGGGGHGGSGSMHGGAPGGHVSFPMHHHPGPFGAHHGLRRLAVHHRARRRVPAVLLCADLRAPSHAGRRWADAAESERAGGRRDARRADRVPSRAGPVGQLRQHRRQPLPRRQPPPRRAAVHAGRPGQSELGQAARPPRAARAGPGRLHRGRRGVPRRHDGRARLAHQRDGRPGPLRRARRLRPGRWPSSRRTSRRRRATATAGSSWAPSGISRAGPGRPPTSSPGSTTASRTRPWPRSSTPRRPTRSPATRDEGVYPETSAIASPSYPLLPTVWMAVALTRGSAASRS